MDNNPAAQEIIEFDQNLAEIEEHINIIIDTMTITMKMYRREAVISAIANALNNKTQNKETACQYLTVACYRIQQMRETIDTIIEKNT